MDDRERARQAWASVAPRSMSAAELADELDGRTAASTPAQAEQAEQAGAAAGRAVTLWVLLWPRPGQEAALVAYEDVMAELIPQHGGAVLARTRNDRVHAGDLDGEPLEVHLIRFPSDQALEAYLADPRRTLRDGDRDRAIARTETLRVHNV